MKIRQILSRSDITAELKATNKDEVLAEMAEILSVNHTDLEKNQIIATLLERENLGSTGIGNGIAIPHGKFPSISQIITGFGRSSSGISFDSQDGKPAHLFFVLLAPENAASLHLKALARLSRLLKDAAFRTRLFEAKDEDEIYNIILSEDEKYS